GYELVPGECKSQFPHAEGLNTPGWLGQITTNPCDYQSVTEGRYGYNAFHLLGIVDIAHPEKIDSIKLFTTCGEATGTGKSAHCRRP
ncbi:MAG TPA: hypothetical protein VK501_00715, partial [Baekduia sp.]